MSDKRRPNIERMSDDALLQHHRDAEQETNETWEVYCEADSWRDKLVEEIIQRGISRRIGEYQ